MSGDFLVQQIEQDDARDFDFSRHEQESVAMYLREFGFIAELVTASKRIVEEMLHRRKIRVHSIEGRAKDPSSFGKKASKQSKHDPLRPMYPDPLRQITDKAAIRIITFFPKTVGEIDQVISTEFDVIEKSDKAEYLYEEEKFGYQSVHYLVTFSSKRTRLPEYERFSKMIIEIQLRTILQHAWAEIEHDIQYKSSATIPKDVKRRFMSLAGLFELADREFQAIHDADRVLTETARTLISEGQFEDVEITASSLKSYLDKKLGADGRMREYSYDWTAQLLKKLGFRSLDDVDKCISRYDSMDLSQIIEGKRQGQLTRFEYLLLAGMGALFIERHPWRGTEWFERTRWRSLNLLKERSVPIAGFDPIRHEVGAVSAGKD